MPQMPAEALDQKRVTGMKTYLAARQLVAGENMRL
jgi:hypothetical protein